MGTSCGENKPWARDKIKELNPKTILDVGAGEGLYLNEINSIRHELPSDLIVDAVEVWEPYINKFNLYDRYDNLSHSDVREHDNFKYNLVILGDVLEHMSEEDATKLWDRISEQANFAMISIPIIHYPQHALHDNPYEVHVEEDWTVERVLEKFHSIIDYKTFEVTGTFIARFK